MYGCIRLVYEDTYKVVITLYNLYFIFLKLFCNFFTKLFLQFIFLKNDSETANETVGETAGETAGSAVIRTHAPTRLFLI